MIFDADFIEKAEKGDMKHSEAACDADGQERAAVSEENPYGGLTDDQKIDRIAAKILKTHRAAFEELAK